MRLWWVLLLTGCGFKADPVGQTGAEGPLIDAAVAGFNPATDCPASYNVDLPGPSTYRLITDAGHFDTANTMCNADAAGATHLVVISSTTELNAISTYIDGMATNVLRDDSIWIGAVQAAMAPQTDTSWLDFNDQDLLVAWATGEPNDNNGSEDGQEQFASMKRLKHYISDTSRTMSLGALCECDGVAIGPMASAAITAATP